MKLGFICPNVPGHLNPMTALARHLQLRNHGVLFLYSSGAAGLPFVPSDEKDQVNENRLEISKMQGEDAWQFGARVLLAQTESILKSLPAVVQANGIDALVIDTVQFYAELGAIQLEMPYIHVSAALHHDYSGYTPLSLYGWHHQTTPAALARNREGVARFVKVLEENSAGIRAHPKKIGPVPNNAIIVKQAPQLELLKRASVCITHAGLNTVLESLAQGVPQVAIPVTFDQPGVAARIAEKQTGVVTSLDKLTADHLSTLLDEVLNDSTYRDNAGKVQKAIAKANGISVAADLIEESLGVTKKADRRQAILPFAFIRSIERPPEELL